MEPVILTAFSVEGLTIEQLPTGIVAAVPDSDFSLAMYCRLATKTLTASSNNMTYLTYGLQSELGEVLGKLKKYIRDGIPETYRQDLILELGDILWYAAVILNKTWPFMRSNPPRWAVHRKRPVVTPTLDQLLKNGPTPDMVSCMRWSFTWLPDACKNPEMFDPGVSAFSPLFTMVDELAEMLGTTLQEIAKTNIEKVFDRYRRSVTAGSGDNR